MVEITAPDEGAAVGQAIGFHPSSTEGSQGQAVPPEVLREAVSAAMRAPSVHNTQPWRFRLGADRIDVLADRSRHLTTLDPEGRQLTLSCGAALGFLRTALRARGLTADVELLPAPENPDLLGHVRVTPGGPPSDDESARAEAIATRHTQRTPFEPRAIPSETVRELRRVVEAEGGWLLPLHRREDQIQLVSLLARADRMEREDPAYLAELRAWVRTDATTDGIPVDILPEHEERHSEVAIRDFDPDSASTGPDAGDDLLASAPVDEHPLVVVLGTDGDSPRDHLVAGTALGALLLEAAAAGIAASPLGQVLDWPGPRAMLRRQLGVVGSPQMVLRMGYGSPQRAGSTSRRTLEEVLVR
jgi:hypothetical protein